MKQFIATNVLAIGLVGALGGAAHAQEETVIRQDDRTIYKKKTVIDFSDVTIQGELTKPEGSYLLNRKKTNFKSLLKARANYIRELEMSLDNL